MSIALNLDERGLCASISGDIDHHNAKTIREALDRAVEKYLPCHLFIDLSDVTFMDSSGIGLVLGRYRNMSKRGKGLTVIVPQGRIRRILTMAAVDKLVTLTDTRII